jgi:hypothetical protein
LAPHRAERVEAIAQQVQAGLRLDDERPLVRVAHVDFGPEVPGRLVVAVHHFALDGYSFSLFLQHTQESYRALRAGAAAPARAAGSATLSAWLHAHHAYAHGEAERQLVHFGEQPWGRYCPAGIKRGGEAGPAEVAAERVYAAHRVIHYYHRGDGSVSEADYLRACELAGRHYVALSMADTQALLAQAAASPEDRYVLALVEALAPLTGRRRLFLSFTVINRLPFVVRERAFETLGHLFEQMPLALDLEGVASEEAQLAAVARARKAYTQGLAFGPLKFVNENPALRADIKALPYPEVCLNVWTNDRSTFCDELTPSAEFPGVENALTLAREFRHASLWLQVMIEPSGLRVELRYPPKEVAYATVAAVGERYAQALRRMAGVEP